MYEDLGYTLIFFCNPHLLYYERRKTIPRISAVFIIFVFFMCSEAGVVQTYLFHQQLQRHTCPLNICSCVPAFLSRYVPMFLSFCLTVILSSYLPIFLLSCVPVFLCSCFFLSFRLLFFLSPCLFVFPSLCLPRLHVFK